jgi:hypothetical protein
MEFRMTKHEFAAQRVAAPRRAILAMSCALSGVFAGGAAFGAAAPSGTLYITASSYAAYPNAIKVGQALPDTNGAVAVSDASYPGVFANDAVDPNFGITSPIMLLSEGIAFTKTGVHFTGPKTSTNITQLTGVVTSFSSKSELAIRLSTDGSALTFMGYQAPLNALDVSNTNTPANIDATNTDTQTASYRAVVQVNLAGGVTAQAVGAYSGNNGRGAILANNANGAGQDEYLLVGNAGNGSGTEPTDIVNNTGVQAIIPGSGNVTSVIGQQFGTPGSKNGFEYGFSVASVGDPADKSGKDDNFRGATVFNNTLYVTKGSGSNGIDTVYQVVPPGGGLPLLSNAGSTQIQILPGFPTGLASNITETNPATEFYPFGIWFANANTLYVADEGSQDLNADPNAGLQKWIFDGTKWNLAYVIQAGLNLDQPYSVPSYLTADNPATTGLRHITGMVSGNNVIIVATTATFSNLADPGADPNEVVKIVDQLDATTLPGGEAFTIVKNPVRRYVYRGVEIVPGS